MSAVGMWAARFRGLFGRRRTGRLDEELQAHLEMLEADYIRRGMPEPTARRAARRELGNVTFIAEDTGNRAAFRWPRTSGAICDSPCAPCAAARATRPAARRRWRLGSVR